MNLSYVKFILCGSFYCFSICNISATNDGIKNIDAFTESVPYDTFLNTNGSKKLKSDENAESGISILSLIPKPGALYVIDSDIKLTKNVTWGNNTKPVIGNSWQNTSISVILIKHPQNKPITIESLNNSIIFLGKAVVIDIQSPVIFKNVKIHRSPDARIDRPVAGVPCKTSANGTLWSGCMIVRAPVKFQGCTFSTSNSLGHWSDIHCMSPHAPLIEFGNNTYNIKHIYFYRNAKLSVVPLLKIKSKDISKFQTLIKTEGTRSNIALSSSMLSDLNSKDFAYIRVGNQDYDKGKVLYIMSASPTLFKDKNNIWYTKTDNVNNNTENIKKESLQFLQKYCGQAGDKTDVNLEVYTSSYSDSISTNQLINKPGYINVDMAESEELKFPSNDWNETIKAGILPLPDNGTAISEINIGVIGQTPLKIQCPNSVNTLKINGNWSKYTGILTVPNNITKICFSGRDIPFGINASHNIEFDSNNSDILYITGDYSKCTGTVSFSNKITKIFLPMGKVPFSIAGTANITIGVSNTEHQPNEKDSKDAHSNKESLKEENLNTEGIGNSISFNKNILNYKGVISLDSTIKTVTLE